MLFWAQQWRHLALLCVPGGGGNVGDSGAIGAWAENRGKHCTTLSLSGFGRRIFGQVSDLLNGIGAVHQKMFDVGKIITRMESCCSAAICELARLP